MVFRGENMLITNNMLKNSLKDYVEKLKIKNSIEL